MPNRTTETATRGDLRSRAASRLSAGPQAHRSATQALGVLHDMASSPSTAANALAVLHELQVHQVELQLQAEELRGSHAELEMALRRQTELYESAPVGNFTVDLGGVMRELNATAATLLGCERDQLLGQPLFAFLAPSSARELRGVLMRVSEGQRGSAFALQLTRHAGDSRTVYANVSADPAGGAFLLALMDSGDAGQARD